MLKIGNANNFRRTLAGLALIAAPLVDLAAAILYPRMPGDPNGDFTVIAADPQRYLLASMLHILAGVLLVPAILGLMHLLRDRAVVLGHSGGGLALLGVLGRIAFTSHGLIQLPAATYPNRTEMLRFGEHAMSSPPFLIFLLTFLAGMYLGLMLLAIAVWRARVAPWWIAACFVLALVMDQFGPAGISFILVNVLLTIGFGFIGLKVLWMSDGEWEQLPAPPRDVQLQPTTVPHTS